MAVDGVPWRLLQNRDVDDARIDGMRLGLDEVRGWIQHMRVGNCTAGWVAALDEMEIHIQAASCVSPSVVSFSRAAKQPRSIGRLAVGALGRSGWSFPPNPPASVSASSAPFLRVWSC